jgi:membrane protease YdiL (CAAX protease family)
MGSSPQSSFGESSLPAVFGYFVLTYALTWTLYFMARETATATLQVVTFYAGVFSPGIIAVMLTAWGHGRAGLSDLLTRLVRVDVPARWYVFALTYMAAAKLATAIIYRAIYGSWPAGGSEPWLLILAATLFSTLMGGQAGEELGWRGYALPRLAARIGFRWAGIVIGVVWAAWHLPLFYWFPQADTYRQSFPTYAVGVVAISVAMTWLYARTNGSLFLTMLMHSAVNQSTGLVSSAVPGATHVFALSTSPVAWMTVASLWTVAIYALIRMPRTGRRCYA